MFKFLGEKMTKKQTVEELAKVYYKENFFGKWELASDSQKNACYNAIEILLDLAEKAGFELSKKKEK